MFTTITVYSSEELVRQLTNFLFKGIIPVQITKRWKYLVVPYYQVIFFDLGSLIMSNSYDVLTAQVTATATVAKSALELIQKLVIDLETAKGDAVKVQALTDQLKAATDPLQVVVAANTPPAPTT